MVQYSYAIHPDNPRHYQRMPVKVDMAVVGGYAVIMYGVERTGRDKKLARLLALPEEEVWEIPDELL